MRILCALGLTGDPLEGVHIPFPQQLSFWAALRKCAIEACSMPADGGTHFSSISNGITWTHVSTISDGLTVNWALAVPDRFDLLRRIAFYAFIRYHQSLLELNGADAPQLDKMEIFCKLAKQDEGVEDEDVSFTNFAIERNRCKIYWPDQPHQHWNICFQFLSENMSKHKVREHAGRLCDVVHEIHRLSGKAKHTALNQQQRKLLRQMCLAIMASKTNQKNPPRTANRSRKQLVLRRPSVKK